MSAAPQPGLMTRFEALAAACPERIAVRYDGGALGYGELNRRANRIAHALRARGVGPDTVVAVCAERSPALLAALYGVVKAGGAYLPVAPATPLLRQRAMLEDGGARLLLSDHPERDGDLGPAVTVLDLAEMSEMDDGPAADPTPVNGPGDLLYVIFTSGSTGRPKGVMLEHRAVLNRLNWMQQRYPLAGADVLLQKTPYIFDVSVWELFWWPLGGASLALLRPGFEKFPLAIAAAVAGHGVTVIHFVPSMLSLFLQALEERADLRRQLAPLRRVFVSGEALTPAHVERFRAVLNPDHRLRLTNLYGPTEAAIDVSFFDIPERGALERVPIGKPIDGVELRLLEPGTDHLCPPGQPGELCIGGVGLARGYANRPALTRECFIRHPLHPGERLYRTGDLARLDGDGNLEFLGRLDQQVKIRGLRIELGDIEAHLAAHPQVAACAVTCRALSEAVPQLIAYLVPRAPGLTGAELRRFMAGRLPDYMLPNVFVPLPELPLTPTGKTDRRALPAPEAVTTLAPG